MLQGEKKEGKATDEEIDKTREQKKREGQDMRKAEKERGEEEKRNNSRGKRELDGRVACGRPVATPQALKFRKREENLGSPFDN
jgi:hypothetical protein